MSQRSSSPNRLLQFRLRTLLIFAAIGPILLTLTWFGGIWLWFAGREWAASAPSPWLMLVVWVMSIVLSVFALAMPPPRDRELDRVVQWMAPVVAGWQFLALWNGLYLLFSYVGWILLWGDNQGSEHELWVNRIACVLSAALASIVAARGFAGLATRTYLLVIAISASTILGLIAPHHIYLWCR